MNIECTIFANKGIGLDMTLAGQKSIAVPAGGSLKVPLTGDQIGHVESFLAAQAKAEKFGPDLAGGKVVRPTPEPPKGSKKHRMLHPEEYVPKPAESKKPIEPVKKGV